MKFLISFALIFVFVFICFGQDSLTVYSFPDQSEYSVKFPAKPTVSFVLLGTANSTISAELKTANGFLRADTVRLSEKEIKNLSKKDDRSFSEILTKYAAASAITTSVKVGTDKLGRYVILGGSKPVNGVPTTFEIRYYLGKSAAITLYTAAAANQYPTAEATKFIDSLTLISNNDAATVNDKKQDQAVSDLIKDFPAPKYPDSARAVRASGTVKVQVEVDEDGNVTSAKALGGHPLLQQSSEQAAVRVKFKPFQINGEKVKAIGVIAYNYVP